MSIQSEINRINNEVSTQTDLISQIASALEGKTAGGGGGGGSSVETCTVTYVFDEGVVYLISYTTYVNGQYIPVLSPIQPASNGDDYVMDNVVKNSAITIMCTESWPFMSSGAELIGVNNDIYCYVFKPTAGVAVIEVDWM